MNKVAAFLFVLPLTVLTLTNTFGQSRFSIAPTIIPGYRYVDFKVQAPGSDSRLYGAAVYRGISAGLTAHYALSPHVSASVGLLYNQSKGEENYQSISTASSIRSTRTVSFESLQLPVLLNYTVSTHRLSPYLSAGVLINYNFRSTYTEDKGGGQITTQVHVKPGDPRAVIIQPMVGIGVQYRVSPAVSLLVQPTAGYELGRPSAGYSDYQVYTFSVQTQLKYTF